MHIFVFTLTIDGAKDAPLVVPFLSVPTFDQLIAGIHLTDKTAPVEAIAAKLKVQGLSDATLGQTGLLLMTARSSGEWPSIENRMEDGSLVCFQLLTVVEPGTKKSDHLTRFRRKHHRSV